MNVRPRQRILDNLEATYREAYERAKGANDEKRMFDLDAAYQREQLLLEVLLDIRDTLAALPPPDGRSGEHPLPDPLAALEGIRRITRLR
jgi:hypothetical protein